MSRNIPVLRFPEYSEDWDFELLDKVSIRGSGHTPNKKFDNYYNGNIKWVSLADSNKLDNGLIENTTYRISDEGIKNSSAVLHKEGSVILSRDAGVGKSAVMKTEMAVSQHFIVWTPIASKLNNWFLYYKLQILKPEFERIAIGSTIKTIGLPYFRKLQFFLPDFPEQTKIANFLTAIDERLNQLKKKKTLLEQYKKGVMQRIFNNSLNYDANDTHENYDGETSKSIRTHQNNQSSRLRFKDDDGKEFSEWEEKKLGEVSIKKSSNISANKIESNEGDFIIYGASGVLKKVDFYAEESDYVSIIKDGAGVGRIFYCEGKTSVLGTMEIIKPRSDINTHFLFCLLHNIDFTKYVTGSTIPHIYYKDYSHEICGIPCMLEQTKIANFLSAIDKKIDQCKKQIYKTDQYKKGLLQQLFV